MVGGPLQTRFVDPRGAMVGQYRIEQPIAWGGMGVVYLARHPLLGSRAAVKVLREELAVHPGIPERFLEEASLASQIRHPNIVQIFDFVSLPDGRPCIVMEYLEGETLAARASRGPMPLGASRPILLQVAAALGATHERGVVHRDLKAENVLLVAREGRDDFVKLLDFGLAKSSALAAGLRLPDNPAGTPYYMAPEQVRGEPCEVRTDVYALGILTYRLVTGRFPFEGGNVEEILRRQLEAAPDWSTLPPSLQAVLCRALAKVPAERFASILEFATVLAGLPLEEAPRAASAPAAADFSIPDWMHGPAQTDPSLPRIEPSAAPPVPEIPPLVFGPAQAAPLGAADPYDWIFRSAPPAPSPAPVVPAPAPAAPAPSATVAPLQPAAAPAPRTPTGAPAQAAVAPAPRTPTGVPAQAAAAPAPSTPTGVPAQAAAAPAPRTPTGVPPQVAAAPAPRTPTGVPAQAAAAPAAPEPTRALPRQRTSPLTSPTAAARYAESASPARVLERYLARSDRDHYAFLGLGQDADFESIREACSKAERELGEASERANPALRPQFAALVGRLARARTSLVELEARAAYDARLGNYRGVARCLEAGLGYPQLQKLHAEWAGRFPDKQARAAQLLATCDNHSRSGDRPRAREALVQALELAPLSPDLQRRLVAMGA